MKKVVVDGETLSIEDVVDVARKYAQVEVSKRAEKTWYRRRRGSWDCNSPVVQCRRAD